MFRWPIRSTDEIKTSHDPISSIPGMGGISCQIMITELSDLPQFKSAREIAARAGVTQCHFVSGTSGRTTTPITKVGSSNLRRALFMSAMNARAFNPILQRVRRSSSSQWEKA